MSRGFRLPLAIRLLTVLLLAVLLAGLVVACGLATAPSATQTVLLPGTSIAITTVPPTGTRSSGPATTRAPPTTAMVREDGRYSTPEDVALYLHTYGRLPRNYLTKDAAMKLGWDAGKGNLWEVTDRMSIGGDVFGNREGLLPAKPGRTWRECDVNYAGGFRGGERIVYSSDGLIYGTKDHYASFTRLY